MNWQSIKVHARDTGEAKNLKMDRAREGGSRDGVEREKRDRSHEANVTLNAPLNAVMDVCVCMYPCVDGRRRQRDSVYWPKANKRKPTETKSQTISGQEAAAAAEKQRQKDGRVNKHKS